MYEKQYVKIQKIEKKFLKKKKKKKEEERKKVEEKKKKKIFDEKGTLIDLKLCFEKIFQITFLFMLAAVLFWLLPQNKPC